MAYEFMEHQVMIILLNHATKPAETTATPSAVGIFKFEAHSVSLKMNMRSRMNMKSTTLYHYLLFLGKKSTELYHHTVHLERLLNGWS
jgi:hypothetical protein